MIITNSPNKPTPLPSPPGLKLLIGGKKKQTNKLECIISEKKGKELSSAIQNQQNKTSK
jgi:hypothetical protein